MFTGTIRIKRAALVFLVIALMGVAATWGTAQPAWAQASPTPLPPTPGEGPIHEGPGLVQGPDGYWYYVGSPTRKPEIQPKANGGPDDFGYTWDDTEPYNWIDATGGTDTGMSGHSWGQGVGPVALPFPFKFYEHTYNALYIAASGYVGFVEEDYWADPRIPSPVHPNNIIAPYATILNLSDSGPTGRVYYASGGQAPNRYFVVEWYQVPGVVEGNLFSFEVVLYENGDIVFQYGEMQYGDVGWACAAAGIEDDVGFDGLAYLGFCDQAPSYRAVRFTRPAPEARVKVFPPYHGDFFAPGESRSFQVSVRNTGEVGADTYDIDVLSEWLVTFYDADGLVELSDTDGDGKVDTGPLAEGDTTTVTVVVTAPEEAAVGDSNAVQVTFTSSLNTAKTQTAEIDGSIPAPFVQVFSEKAGWYPSMYLVQPNSQMLEHVAPGGNWALDSAVVQTPTGFLNLWSETRQVGNDYRREIHYALLDHAGNVTQLGQIAAEDVVYAYDPAVAVLPGGQAGIVGSNLASEVYFEVLDSASGDVLAGPILVSAGVDGDNGGSDIAPTGDGRFVVAWIRWNPDTYDDIIYYAVLDSNGHLLHAPTAVTTEVCCAEVALAPINSTDVLLAYTIGGTAYTLILDSYGNIVQPATQIADSAGAWWWIRDALLLPNGQVALVWEGWSEGDTALWVAVVNGDNTLAAGPVALSHPAAFGTNSRPSLTTDLDGHIIVTWAGTWTYSPYLFYALLDAAGNVLVPPSIALEGEDDLLLSYTGQGSTTYLTFGDVPYTSWAANWIERLARAGITAGCGNGMYCPNESVTRAQMAVFLERGIHGADYQPPTVEHSRFNDVPDDFWAKDWIEALANDGVTTGCGEGVYCPGGLVTRAQMAVFLLRAKYGADYQPPHVEHSQFNDIPDDFWAKDWVEQLAVEGITSGCGGGNYCPNSPVTRAQMAVFLVRTFNLP